MIEKCSGNTLKEEFEDVFDDVLIDIGPLSVYYPPGCINRQVSEQSRKKKILRNNYLIKRNQLVLVRGASGSGKSTLLSLIKGIIPDSIFAVIEGRFQFVEPSANVFCVFQNPYSQLVCPTVKEDLVFTMENRGFSQRKMAERLTQFSNFFNLFHLLENKTSKISGGECQKIVLASSLAADPTVLLLDEPTAFLDKDARDEFYAYLAKLKGKYTIIIVDHHQEQILSLADQVIDLDVGIDIDLGKKREHTLVSENWGMIRGAIQENYCICIDKLSFSYAKDAKTQSNFCLKDLNLNIESGKIVTILGQNGSGKSTLLKLISGVLRPTAGNIVIKQGCHPLAPKEYCRHICYLMQNPESHFLFDSIAEEIEFNYRKRGDRSGNISEIFGYYFNVDIDVDVDLSRSPLLLSEGEKRRLTFLMAVLEEKGIMLYDEPTFGQDDASCKKIVTLMKKLREHNRLQIIITHDEKMAYSISDIVYRLCQGRLIDEC
ncbi:MAG: ABC transporter ATP-binding protein [Oligoflexia bacterium]|nr:ABC transporter ATP-binding protein [Oligoflexia bacterium]